MNEQELRHALRATMATVPAPPPMNETPMLDAARRVRRRRRARWAGVGSAVAAVAVIGAVATVTSGANGYGVGGRGGEPKPAVTGPSTTRGEQPADTETSWPEGQTDATARSGPRYETGITLLERLATAVPPGYGAPEDLTFEEPGYDGESLRTHQAAYDGTVGGTEVWDYQAAVPVTRDQGVGRLLVEVATPGGRPSGDGCGLPPLWGLAGSCEEHVVGDRRVGVYTAVGGVADFHSWAVYRYEDGTVVYLAQSVDYPGSAKPGLAAVPLPAARLAELATDPRFHLG